MLRILRNKKIAKKIWIGLAIIIVPAFLFWGLGSAVRSKQESGYAGKIFGRKITVLEYKDALEATKNQMIMQFGDNLSEIQKYLNLESQAWNRLILLSEAKNRRIKVTDKEVIESIQSNPFFKNKRGKFDNRIYSEMLRYLFRTQPRIFEEQNRQNIILYKLFKEVADKVNLTEQEIKEEYRKANEEISVYYIASIPFNFAKDMAPPEQDIKDYFAKNSLQFKKPLSFNLEFISLPKDDKDKRATKNKIKILVSRLNKKESFAKVAKDSNLELKETGLFTQTEPIPGIGWSPQILNLISKLKVGQFASPINMDKYYLILRLKEKKEPNIPVFESIKDRVKEMFIKDKSGEIAKGKIENCLKKLQEIYQANPKSEDFNKVAQEFGLKSDSTGMFKYGGYIEGVGASDNFCTVADKLKEGELSQVIEMASGFYIIKLKSRVPIDESKFQSEKAEFSKKVLAQKKEDHFNKFFEGLSKKVQLF